MGYQWMEVAGLESFSGGPAAGDQGATGPSLGPAGAVTGGNKGCRAWTRTTLSLNNRVNSIQGCGTGQLNICLAVNLGLGSKPRGTHPPRQSSDELAGPLRTSLQTRALQHLYVQDSYESPPSRTSSLLRLQHHVVVNLANPEVAARGDTIPLTSRSQKAQNGSQNGLLGRLRYVAPLSSIGTDMIHEHAY